MYVSSILNTADYTWNCIFLLKKKLELVLKTIRQPVRILPRKIYEIQMTFGLLPY